MRAFFNCFLSIEARLQQYEMLSEYRKLATTLFTKFIPKGNMDAYSEDVQKLSNFYTTYFGNWDKIPIFEILDSPFIEMLERLFEFMQHIEENQKNIIYSRVWLNKFHTKYTHFDSHLRNSFLGRINSIFFLFYILLSVLLE